MLKAILYAAERSAPTAVTWWFAPLGGFLAAGLLWLAGVPVTFSEWLPNSILRSGFEVLDICILAGRVSNPSEVRATGRHHRYPAEKTRRTNGAVYFDGSWAFLIRCIYQRGIGLAYLPSNERDCATARAIAGNTKYRG